MAKDPFADIVRQSQRGAPLRLHKSAPEADDDAEGTDDPRRYKAVMVASRVPRLDIIPATGPGQCPSYISLVTVVIDERHPTICTVIFNFLIVIITGRNLTPVANAIKKHKAEWIKGYDAKRFDAPEEGVPVIERMEFRMGQTIESMVEIISQAAG